MMFLEQYWGGPHTYSELRGHPRLRMRHAEFAIDAAARDVWLGHMRAALDDVAMAPAADQVMWTYLSTAADALVNVP
jgi:hemoglobin